MFLKKSPFVFQTTHPQFFKKNSPTVFSKNSLTIFLKTHPMFFKKLTLCFSKSVFSAWGRWPPLCPSSEPRRCRLIFYRRGVPLIFSAIETQLCFIFHFIFATCRETNLLTRPNPFLPVGENRCLALSSAILLLSLPFHWHFFTYLK